MKLREQRIQHRFIMRLMDEFNQRLGHNGADALNRDQLLAAFGLCGKSGLCCAAQGFKAAKVARQALGIDLANMTDAQRINETVEGDAAPRLNGGKQIFD